MKLKIYDGLESLNSKLNEESYIRELEQRLETDPPHYWRCYRNAK